MRLSCIVALFGAVGLLGCQFPFAKSPESKAAPIMRRYGCVSCHTIPGIAGASATVGPPLDRLGNRTYLAGILPNTPENLAFWIQHPQEVHHGTAMPEMHVTPDDAKAITQYLETLH
jgi:cytochrome c1